MKTKDYATHALPFNVMLTLYMNLKDQEKVEALVSEMMQSNIDLDLYSYNIWISSRGSQGSIEKMEEAFEKLIFDESVNPNWTTHSTMATLYINNSRFDKAEDCLRKIETLITVSVRRKKLKEYGNLTKQSFQYIPNLGYSAVISSFIRMDDIEEAELLYEEWVSMKTSYDPRIGDLLLGWYVRNGLTEKAETFLKEMLNVGKANSSTCEIVAEGHIKESRISDALSCLEKVLTEEGLSFWRSANEYFCFVQSL
ncbi:Pentatricopeptide repeat-containing protein [Artemisia annua]|uniref:Pentatricopeptide repeat-containing protein n=1 Tax=Artemisia annua TaxID=35608 RepID=A0A2U1P2N3_ARTAN|nr:Pentatricopeptide repeat-containing protein [Artemisia annua]